MQSVLGPDTWRLDLQRLRGRRGYSLLHPSRAKNTYAVLGRSPFGSTLGQTARHAIGCTHRQIGQLHPCAGPTCAFQVGPPQGATRLKTAPDVRLLQRATHHFHSTLGCTGRGPPRMRTPVNLNQFLTGTRGPQGRDITQPHAQTNSGTGFHIFCAICADNRGMEKRPCV